MQVETAARLAHDARQFLVNDANESLARRQALHDLGPDCARTRRVGERLDNGNSDIRLEQSHAHLPERLRDVLLSHARTPAQRVDGLAEPVGEHVEHRNPRSPETFAGDDEDYRAARARPLAAPVQ